LTENKAKFSLKTTLQIIAQVLDRLEVFHNAGYIHRDLKPENLVTGNDENNQHIIFLIDFGLAKTFKTKSNKHQEFQNNAGMVGTTRYTSVNSHLGYS
jgi:serine/threonine protein kinase